MASFRFSKLDTVIFDSCVVDEIDFHGAELKNVKFINSNIDRIELAQSKLINVDLRDSTIVSIKRPSDLKGVIINNHQLIYLSPYLANEAGIKIED